VTLFKLNEFLNKLHISDYDDAAARRVLEAVEFLVRVLRPQQGVEVDFGSIPRSEGQCSKILLLINSK
jgi:hypothetical protein